MRWARPARSLAALALVVWAPRAIAAGPLGPNGAPITTNRYTVDLYQGPVFAGTRITGLGGAFVAIAEDTDGNKQNPATPAVRPFFSYPHFDYWLGWALTFPATFKNDDFFNTGSRTNLANADNSFVYFAPAANLQFGELGIGAALELQNYALTKAGAGDTGKALHASIPTLHLQIAHGFSHNQWVFGVGARLVSLNISPDARDNPLVSSSGVGLEAGGLWKPEGLPLRLGLAYYAPVRAEASKTDGQLPNAAGDLVVTGAGVGSIYVPETVALPWDFNFGFAVQLGPRPLNPPWRSAELTERPRLLHRLRQIDRETRRDDALRRAPTLEERRAVEHSFDEQQEDDDRVLERELENARRTAEAALTKMNGFYVLFSGSMLVTGPVENGIGVESMVTQTVNRSGQRTVASPRFGVESGVIPTLLKLRAGTYVEPSRFDDVKARVHGTVGLDLKLIRWDVFGLWPEDYVWRLGLSFDGAARYSAFGITLAGWYPRHTDPNELQAR